MTRRAVLAGAAATVAAPAPAEMFPTPSQDTWDVFRRPAPVAEGPRLSHVGCGDTGGAPVILLHGHADNGRSRSRVGPWREGFHAPALDPRGRGASEAADCCHGLDALSRDVAPFMDHPGIARAHVMGHSLGAAPPEARCETFGGHGHDMFREVPERAGTMIADVLND